MIKRYDREAEIVYFIYQKDQCIYVGQTFNLTCRKAGHLSALNAYRKNQEGSYLYKYIVENKINWDDLMWKEINFFKNISREDLNKIEKLYIQTMKPIGNTVFKVKDYNRSYYESNKTTILEKRKIYRANIPKVICDCGSVIKNVISHNTTKKHLKFIKK